jgi:hypothetical protein
MSREPADASSIVRAPADGGVTAPAATRADSGRASSPRRLLTSPVPLGFAALTLLVAAFSREVFDDPWILYRYAENLAAGHGWTFNPGSPSENAVTSPLVVLLLAGPAALGLPVAVASGILFVAGTWTAAYCSYLTLGRSGHRLAGVATGVLVITAPPLLSLRGMESAVYLGLLAASLLALTVRRPLLLGVCLGLAVLARPDAALFVVAVVAWQLVRDRRIPWRTLTGGALVGLPWLAVSVPLTGGVLPSTLAAKVAQEDSGQWAGYVRGLALLPLEPGMTLWFALAVPVALLGILPALRDCRTALVPLAAAAVALVLAYGFVLDVASYPWYSALPVFLLTWFAGLGVETVGRLAPTHAARVVVAAALLAVLAGTAVQTPAMAGFRDQYAEAGRWIRAHSPEGATVAGSEIGRVGYFSEREMVDYLGLLDSQANEHVRRGEWDWWLDVYRPDFWVTYRPDSPAGNWVVETSVRDSAELAASYEPVMRTQDLVVFQRRDNARP